MEEVHQQPSPTTAPSTAAQPAPNQTPTNQPQSQSPTHDPSPVNPPPNPATHYPNGLPRSINGLKSIGTNGNGNGNGNGSPASPIVNSGSATPVQTSIQTLAQQAVSSPATGRAAPSPVAPPLATAPVLAPAPPRPVKPMKPIIIYTPTTMPKPTHAPQIATPHQQLKRQSSMSSSHKVSIIDPPGAYSRSRNNSYHSPQGYPSPKREHQLENPKFIDDLSRLTHAVQQSVPVAVRRVIRDNWEKCLLGSEFHHAFLLNAVIHHSNGVIVRRSIKDFGAKMVSESKHEIVAHLQTADLDELAGDILEKASDYFLDQALEKRLRTIDARALINALARAERLGYENSDVLDEQRDEGPKFNPAPFPVPQLAPAEPASRAQRIPSQPSLHHARAAPPQVLQCPLCWRKFHFAQPYEYHVQKQICTKEPPNKEGFPYSCQYCGTGFITKVGRQYHIDNNVCGDHGTMPATPKAPGNSGSPITLSSGNNSPVQPPMAAAQRLPESQQQFNPMSQYIATPVQPRASVLAGTPSSQPREQDPYAHLNPSTLDKLNEELQQAESTYTLRFKQAEQIADPALRQSKLEGLHNSFSTKQSIIRKKYGVRLRNRRTKAEIDNERHRMGWKHPIQSDSPEAAPSAKRQRTDDGPSDLGVQILTSNGQEEKGHEIKSNHLPISDMTAGLGGSKATVATADPTLPNPTPSQESGPTQNSLSSYQRKGYRVSSHLPQPQPNQVSPTDTAMKDAPLQRNGSATAPLVVDDEDDSTDTDSDGDIPASLPPPTRAGGSPSKGLAG
ncbi:hypothetical protein GGR54DRAFT_271891 [Hypoxylon sp. NC1633]|nr:hypothetical protein GGR54DRAFT_271891 [Hypoxylon sp. NC1633]